MRSGARVRAKQQLGRFLNWYGGQAVVRLDNGKTQAFPIDDIRPVEEAETPAKLKLIAPVEHEEDIQAEAITQATRAGYIVLQTSVRYQYQKCPDCGCRFRPVGGSGSTPGVPDTLLTHETWPIGLFIGIEQKGPKTLLSEHQQLLQARGRIIVARAVETTLTQTQAMHEQLTRAFKAPHLDQDAIAKAQAKVEAKILERYQNRRKRK